MNIENVAKYIRAKASAGMLKYVIQAAERHPLLYVMPCADESEYSTEIICIEDDDGDEFYFYALYDEYAMRGARIRAPKEVGYYVHVLNDGWRDDFMDIGGHICATDIGAAQFVRAKKLAVVLKGVPEYAYDYDCHSFLYKNTRYAGTRVGNQSRPEYWIAPASCELVAIAGDDGLARKMRVASWDFGAIEGKARE